MQSASALATAYMESEAVVPTETEVQAFKAWIERRYSQICQLVFFINEDVSPERMLGFWRIHGKLLISVTNNDHPILSQAENAAFRAIHDWDHIRTGAGFDLDGEMQAFHAAAETAPSEIRWILFSEIILQASAAIHTGRFQPQKVVLPDFIGKGM